MMHSFGNTLTAEEAVIATPNTQRSGPTSGLPGTVKGTGGRLLKGPLRPDNCHWELRTAPSA